MVIYSLLDWQFSLLFRFSTNAISLRSGKAEMKKLRRSRQARYLGASSIDSFLPRHFPLTALAHDSKVNLLAGFPQKVNNIFWNLCIMHFNNYFWKSQWHLSDCNCWCQWGVWTYYSNSVYVVVKILLNSGQH